MEQRKVQGEISLIYRSTVVRRENRVLILGITCLSPIQIIFPLKNDARPCILLGIIPGTMQINRTIFRDSRASIPESDLLIEAGACCTRTI